MKQELETSHNFSIKLDPKINAAESKLLNKFKEVKQLRDNHNYELHTVKTVIQIVTQKRWHQK